MKYVLLIFLEFQKYKNHTNLQITTGNRLIDEVNIDRDIGIKKELWSNEEVNQSLLRYSKECHFAYEYDQPSDWVKENKGISLPCTQKVLYYELKGNAIGTDIKVKIHDNNSNYTNGFLTKSNLIKFRYFCLIPKKLLNKEKLNRIALLFKRMRTKNTYAEPYTDHVYTYYLVNESASRQYDPHAIRWPTVDYVSGDWYGGTKEFVIPVVKKYNMLMLDAYKNDRKENQRTRVVFESDFLFLADYYGLINIDNENQRSDNARTSDSRSHIGG
mgnify:FL=1|tara:strand:+ start:587 stop:1402 length:816 start_codon:yes stop_codon:yes gene_type:complete